ncbi:hypothetical protein ACFXDE_16640 [Kitasatospora sp. NPDC059408]|uniref:hypothetical protein n=1 Tax=Kitasatospora sp. NPDC059408 TaxID=3346823 RepID=UPI0036C9D45D
MTIHRPTKQVAALGIAITALAGCSSGPIGAAPGGSVPHPTTLVAVSPSPSPFPSPTGPAIHGDTIKAQVVSVGTSAALPGVAAPAGKTALLVRLKVTSDPEGRTARSPMFMAWAIRYPACESIPGTGCWNVDGESHFLTEADARAGHTFGAVWPGRPLEADTAYFAYIWKFVPEGDDLHEAKLCTFAGTGECIPLGPVTALAPQDVRSLDLAQY